MEQADILKILRRKMENRLGPNLKKIVLFGSRSRGDNDPDSDYDILVVVDDIREYLRLR
jgi:predicted nucleotidyltransferase